MTLTSADKQLIIDKVFLDVEKTWFESICREQAMALYEQDLVKGVGENESNMKTRLKRVVVTKRPLR